MKRNRYVYRATALYDDILLNTTRHFLTKRTRDRWADQRLAGYPAEEDFLGPVRDAIPPAREVIRERSEPVVFR